MGLDFMVYKVKRNSIDINDADKAWKATENAEELAYGRKSWEIVDYLKVDTQKTYSRISKADWDALIKHIKQIEFVARKLHAFNIDEMDDDDEEANMEYNTLLGAYEIWHRSVFDSYPTLGYDFSVAYVLNFLDADAKAQEAFADEDSEVWGFASY